MIELESSVDAEDADVVESEEDVAASTLILPFTPAPSIPDPDDFDEDPLHKKVHSVIAPSKATHIIKMSNFVANRNFFLNDQNTPEFLYS
jgi:hypothetical protein